jgi:AraC-like DNA-binding protein
LSLNAGNTLRRSGRYSRRFANLSQRDSLEILVKEVALANGFWHLPHFSPRYRELFGELPSQTLGRDPA